ncbi:MAG: ABC transporter permease [Spirochaetota bacterium]
MLHAIGSRVLRAPKELTYGLGFMVEIVRNVPAYFRMQRRGGGGGVLKMQILFTGVNALSIVAVLSLAIGAIIIIQGLSTLPQFGQGQLIYTLLIAVITRELGPILTAFIVIARSGTAISTELGNMVVDHQIEAYMATGLNPITYHAVPRVIGVVVSLVLLNIYFNFFGLVGSFLVTQLVQPLSLEEYLFGLYGSVSLVDFVASFTKSVVFGVIIGSVATYQGLAVERAGTEVPVRAIKAVGQGITLTIVANAAITLASYL